MSRIRIRREDEVRGLAAFHAAVRYEELARSTPAGRESIALRERAGPYLASDREDAAFPLLKRALEILPDDDSPATCSARFDLAVCYLDLGGVEEENLREARRLLERCLASVHWKRDVKRVALAKDALGRVLRRLAARSRSGRRGLEREAVTAMGEACQAVSPLGTVGWTHAACYYQNLGNLLRQLGRHQDAVRAYEEGLRFARAVIENASEPFVAEALRHRRDDLFANGLVNLATGLVALRSPVEAERALRLLDQAEQRGEGGAIARAAIVRVEAMLVLGRKEQAKIHVRGIDFRALPEDLQFSLLDLAEHAGDDEVVLSAGHAGVAEALAARQDALADHVAQHADRRAQRFGAALARAHARAGRPVDCFLALENVSGLSWYDEVTAYFRPLSSDALHVATNDVAALHAVLAKAIDGCASRLVYEGEDEQRREIRRLADHLANLDDSFSGAHRDFDPAVARLSEELYRGTTSRLCEAAAAASPTTALREVAEHHAEERARLQRVIAARWPETIAKPVWCREMIAGDLEGILAAEPGRVLIRVHLSDQLLGVALWWEGGRVQGRCLQRALPDAVIDSLHASVYGRGDESDPGPALASLDLGSLLPEDARHVVILPSLVGMFVPWAATGTPMLLHRCEAISILPSLVALWGRQTAARRRCGTLSVVPGAAAARATQYHEVALAAEVRDERRLLGVDAGLDRVMEAVRDADVVCFYAHGQNGSGGDEQGILLADRLLDPADTQADWSGIERVELWACRTGVNFPTDWLTPLVDDGFGMDVTFHGAGVRSTIGTLWDASDFVTACLVHRYRRALGEGSDAPRALAEAQRWWLSDAVPALERRMLGESESDAVIGFLADLGASHTNTYGLASRLGPARLSPRLSDTERALRVSQLRSPLAWAGYRFVGVAERRPAVEWIGPPAMTEAQREELSVLVAQEPPPPVVDLDDAWDDWIAGEYGEIDGSTDPARAVRVARLYAGRRRSRPAHNLLRALAWLHEALSGAPAARDRSLLRREAAWAWLELAFGEVPDQTGLAFLVPVAAYLDRVLSLSEMSVESALQAAWVAVLRAPPDARAGRARAGWEAVSGRLDADDLDGYARHRLWAYAAELLLLAGPTAPDIATLEALPWERPVVTEDAIVASRWLLYLSLCHAAVGRQGPTIASLHDGPGDIRVTGARPSDRLVQARPGFDPNAPLYSFRVDHLPLRDLARATSLLWARVYKLPELRVDARRELDRGLGLLEEAYWGQPSDGQRVYLATTGSPGRAWRGAGGGYLSSSAREPGAATRVVHFLAWLQLSADLRVGPLRALAQLAAAEPVGTDGPIGQLWHPSWSRDVLMSALEDASAAPSRKEPDPFSEPGERLLEAEERATWLLGFGVNHFWERSFPGRTGAMAAVRQLHWLDQTIDETWTRFRRLAREMEVERPEGARHLQDSLDPGVRVTDMEKLLRELLPGQVRLGLTVGAASELLAFACWNDGRTLQQRLHVGEPGTGLLLAHGLTRVLAFVEEDHGPTMGVARSRGEAWTELSGLLAPALSAVLEGGWHPERHLRVFAPGPLRALPVAGLVVGGMPLRRRFASVGHLPDLRFGRAGFARPADGTRPLLCTFGEERLQGETCFGAAAIGTLRRWFPPDVVTEPREPRGSEVVEVHPLQDHARTAAIVRFYGVGEAAELTPSSAGLRLSGGRSLGLHNLRHLAFGRCRAVEVWAATSPTGELWGLNYRGTDTLPPLVRTFLMSGAHGVIDLAWPVHDLVKALVVELYSGMREARPDAWEPTLLAGTLDWVEEILGEWRRLTFPSVRHALRALDDLRGSVARAAKLDPAAIIRFETLADAPSVAMPVGELQTVITRPSQLAAFRWWGA